MPGDGRRPGTDTAQVRRVGRGATLQTVTGRAPAGVSDTVADCPVAAARTTRPSPMKSRMNAAVSSMCPSPETPAMAGLFALAWPSTCRQPLTISPPASLTAAHMAAER